MLNQTQRDMKKIIVLILLVALGFTLQAQQVPNHIRGKLIELVKKADKEKDENVIKQQLRRFVASAPNEKAKKGVLQFAKSKSKSATVQKVVDELLHSKIEQKENAISKEFLVLKNAFIINMLSNETKEGTIIIKSDKIQHIDYASLHKIPENAEVFDLKGKYIIPGLIDGHVHITHGTFDKAKHHLEEAVKNGITSVRDMGGDGRMLTLLKRNTLIGEDPGPDVFFSSIIAGPEFFVNDKRPQSVALGTKAGEVPWQKAITHNTDLRQAVAELKGLGATAIKVYMNVDKELFKKVADEAKRQEIKVWAHAVVPPTKGIDITNGGADAMSHAGDLVQYEFVEGDLKTKHSFKNRENALAYKEKLENIEWNENNPEVKRLFTAMKNNNSILDATLHVYNKPNREKDLANALKAVRIAHQMGVKIGAGSDNMITEKKAEEPILNIHGELKLLTQAGLSNFEALQAATIVNAEIIGEEKNIGTIENGKLANLVVLNANPLDNISNTTDIDFVIKRGKVIESN